MNRVAVIGAFSLAACLTSGGQMTAAPPPPPPPTYDQAIKKVIAQRRQVASGHLVLKSETVAVENGQERPRSKHDIELWFDPGRIRADVKAPAADKKDVVERVVNIDTPKEHIFWIGHTPRDKVEHSLVVAKIFPESLQARRANGNQSPNPAYQVADPRNLGYAPVYYLNLIHYDANSLVDRADAVEPSVAWDEGANGGNWKVSYKLKEKTGVLDVEMIISNDNNLITSISIKRKRPKGGVLLDSTHVTYKQHGKLWFPSAARTDRKTDGVLTAYENLEFTTVELNGAVDDKVFTLDGINLPKGAVVDLPRGQERVWDGSGLVPRLTYEVALDEAEHQTRSEGRLLGLIPLAALVLAVPLCWYGTTRRIASGSLSWVRRRFGWVG